MKLFLLFLVGISAILQVDSDHLVLGNVSNRVKLANRNETKVEYSAIPFIKRVKYYFYSHPLNKNIQGIQALDNLHSKASINITAGGVGFSYVNMRLKSERGSGLNYNIGIYVNENYI